MEMQDSAVFSGSSKEGRLSGWWTSCSSHTGQTTSLTLFDFDGWRRLWLLGQMAVAHASMNQCGLQFYRLVGSGGGLGFDTRPNFGRYGILATWPDRQTAEDGVRRHRVFSRWRRAAVREESWLLAATRSTGAWGGRNPFEVSTDHIPPDARGPIGVLTRARLSARILGSFWQQVPSISDQIAQAPGLVTTTGLSEMPYLYQITFSLWEDEAAIRRFAYKNGAHAAAARQAKTDSWFREDLFARFRLVATRQSEQPGL